MIHCENCRYYKEQFDIDDFGQTFDYCKCGLTDDLLDDTERECADYVEC